MGILEGSSGRWLWKFQAIPLKSISFHMKCVEPPATFAILKRSLLPAPALFRLRMYEMKSHNMGSSGKEALSSEALEQWKSIEGTSP
jgi:hypothetical protein